MEKWLKKFFSLHDKIKSWVNENKKSVKRIKRWFHWCCFTCISLSFILGEYFSKYLSSNILNLIFGLFVFTFLLEVAYWSVVLAQSLIRIIEFMIESFYKRRRAKIERNVFLWIRKEKFGDIEQLNQRLDIYNVEFPKEIDTSPKRMAFLREIICINIPSKVELRDWYLFLEAQESTIGETLIISTLSTFAGYSFLFKYIKISFITLIKNYKVLANEDFTSTFLLIYLMVFPIMVIFILVYMALRKRRIIKVYKTIIKDILDSQFFIERGYFYE